MSECPCGSGQPYDACCGPIIAGTQLAATAEAVMRSRYSAYVMHTYEHLRDTLSGAEQKDFSLEQAKSWSESSDWLGLKILRTEAGGPDDAEGLVEFNARFRTGGKEHDHHEIARFAREDGKWVYAGQVEQKIETFRREAPKVGRNDPCPCGSGKKFKKCCGSAA